MTSYRPPRIKQKIEKPKFVRPAILLHPNIPKPLHRLAPRAILGQEWWDEQRQKAYKKNNYCCWACGIHKSEAKYHNWLEAHESYKINYEEGWMKLEEIVALCHSCHNFIHSGRLKVLLERGEIDQEKYNDIISHGQHIIDKFGLIKTESPSKFADWGKWRLILNNKEYYTPYKDESDWEEKMREAYD